MTRSTTATEEAAENSPADIRVEYQTLVGTAPLSAGLLAAVRFGAPAGRPADAPLTIDVELPPLQGPAVAEAWLANGAVHTGRSGIVRYAHDDHFLFAVIEEDEREYGNIRQASEVAYAAIRKFQSHSPFRHLLRMWNYLDAINEGAGDLERYREFCVGRARGLDTTDTQSRYPAATAIGRQHATHQLQVFWLAGRTPGTAVENPRQVSAYHYPRAHGPVSPSFSRATLAPDGTVLISGTASIVGHVSQHPDDALAQLEETLRNLTALTAQAGRDERGAKDLLKVYVRDPALVAPIAARLQQVLPDAPALFVAADICRRELLLEIECVRGT